MSSTTTPQGAHPPQHRAAELSALAALAADAACARFEATPEGLTADEAEARLASHGPNIVSREQKPTIAGELWSRARNPLNALLLALAAISFALGDTRAAAVIGVMVVLAIVTAFVQEHRSNEAAARLRALVRNTATVRRRDGGDGFHEVALEKIVPGDIVRLSAGDMIPADLRLLDAKDLFVNQSALTGEAMPAEKSGHVVDKAYDSPFDIPNMCFMGANVVSGYATGLVVSTGRETFFGEIAEDIGGRRGRTAFDRGIDRFTGLMIRFMAVMVPAVFLINGITKHDWLEALLFAVAVAVGLTPELLPMIVTVNLAKGAIAMAREKVIVKRLAAIQNFGAMDVLCSDKTGTLTQDRIILKRHLDIHGEDSAKVLELAYLNSHFQTGLKNLLDVAVLQHVEMNHLVGDAGRYTKVDEIPFDFARRRLSIVVADQAGGHMLVCKGAVEEIFAACTRYEVDGETGRLDDSHFAMAAEETRRLNEQGFRVVAVAYKNLPQPKHAYALTDEADLTLAGYIAFLDPPKETAAAAITALRKSGVTIKILTGDNPVITAKICRDVGLDPGEILLGRDVADMNDAALQAAAERTAVFAKLTPTDKERVVGALHRAGHVVGFMGDGINDSPALKAADVGISVDTAVDIAKEQADIILLEKSLLVLYDGVIEGRKVFGNITKYIRMGASSNFGNMFSVLGTSLFLPFLPMAPIQVLTNNLLYDFSQTAIPSDNVDDEYLAKPRSWDIDGIFKFMLVLGPVSSLFDYVTFAAMIALFGGWTDPALFQTGWFVESILTQTLVIHVIRTARVPVFESRASILLTMTTLAVAAAGILLPQTWAGAALGFKPLPWTYWPVVFAIVSGYAVLAHVVKVWFVRRWGM